MRNKKRIPQNGERLDLCFVSQIQSLIKYMKCLPGLGMGMNWELGLWCHLNNWLWTSLNCWGLFLDPFKQVSTVGATWEWRGSSKFTTSTWIHCLSSTSPRACHQNSFRSSPGIPFFSPPPQATFSNAPWLNLMTLSENWFGSLGICEPDN